VIGEYHKPKEKLITKAPELSETSGKKPKLSWLILIPLWIGNILLPEIVQLLIVWILPNPSQDLIVEENNWIQLVIQTFSSGSILLILMLLFKSKSQRLLTGIGLETPKLENRKRFLDGLSWGVLLIGLRELVSFLVRFVSIYYDPTNLVVMILYSILFSLITSVNTEIFYRGFMQNQFNARLSPILSVLLIAFLSFIGTMSFNWSWDIYAAFTTSLVFGYMYNIFKNLYLNIGWYFAYLLIPTFGTLLFNYTPFNPSYINRLQVVINAIAILGLFVYEKLHKKQTLEK
jgi:membrane protease YdiL (CAAX protease family)